MIIEVATLAPSQAHQMHTQKVKFTESGNDHQPDCCYYEWLHALDRDWKTSVQSGSFIRSHDSKEVHALQKKKNKRYHVLWSIVDTPKEELDLEYEQNCVCVTVQFWNVALNAFFFF